MRPGIPLTAVLALTVSLTAVPGTYADPCGMVPPIYDGPGTPITRIGEQNTYVFYRDGVETIVIRPGFSGNVDEFGMLIPFPDPPAVRKVSDHIFGHIAAAIDPPEVVIDLSPRPAMLFGGAAPSRSSFALGLSKQLDTVRVVRREAVGMYEVVVLESGSAKALKRWMDDHGFRYPVGMDDVTNEYIQSGWCFVAVKTKVGQKAGVDPQPGQRRVNPNLPSGSTFDGYVQAMGFRFKTDELVVPMRLSAFNDGELRNVVYLLTDGPRRIRSIPAEYVVRQIPGRRLFRNVTDPLPLRIIGGTEKDLKDVHKRNLAQRRDPVAKNGAARELFAADLRAVQSNTLSLPHEEQEKELLRIGERFGLRGADIDNLNAQALKTTTDSIAAKSLKDLKPMTLTVIDGDFPREVLASQNLTFAPWRMPAERNNPAAYDAKLRKPRADLSLSDVLKTGALDAAGVAPATSTVGRTGPSVPAFALLGLGAIGFVFVGRSIRRRHAAVLVAAIAGLMYLSVINAAEDSELDELISQLSQSDSASAAVEQLVEQAKSGPETRSRVVKWLYGEAVEGKDMARRGWTLVALSEIGGADVDGMLLRIHDDAKQPMLVRTWAAAARVSMTTSTTGLIEKAALIGTFPALGRPIGLRLVDSLNRGDQPTAESLLGVAVRTPALQKSLGPAILALGPKKLSRVLVTANDQNVRRTAAGYLGTLSGQGNKDVARQVIAVYRFDPQSDNVSWAGGPLFLPGLNWQRDDARQLVGHLVAWHLWCDRHGKTAEQQQIHNNLRSLSLAKAAGYTSPGFQTASTAEWLTIWGKAAGYDAIEKLLKTQGVEDDPPYAGVLKNLR